MTVKQFLPPPFIVLNSLLFLKLVV